MDAEDAGELVDLHDLLFRRSVAEGVLDVVAEAGLIEVGGGRVDGDVVQLFDFWRKGAVAPWDGREVEVGLEEVGVKREQAVPEAVPVPPLVDKTLAELPLPLG